MTTDVFVAVVGSINADATYSVEQLPQPGETVLSTGRHDAPGDCHHVCPASSVYKKVDFPLGSSNSLHSHDR